MFTYISNETGKVIRNVNTENKLANTVYIIFLYKLVLDAGPIKNY
jgi:hypothetical protein